MLADCLHDLAALGPGGLPALLGALFLAGLAGGVSHCSTMCAPFVLAQAATGVGAGGGRLQRLAGAALLPYQAGRMLGYGALGAVAGGAAGLVTLASGLRWGLAALLVLAAVLMLAQASKRLGGWVPRLGWPRRGCRGRWSGGSARCWRTRPDGAACCWGCCSRRCPAACCMRRWRRRRRAAARWRAGSGMMAFVLGTVPALTGVALLGRFFARWQGPGRGVAGGALFALNGVVLLAMAARLVA